MECLGVTRQLHCARSNQRHDTPKRHPATVQSASAAVVVRVVGVLLLITVIIIVSQQTTIGKVHELIPVLLVLIVIVIVGACLGHVQGLINGHMEGLLHKLRVVCSLAKLFHIISLVHHAPNLDIQGPHC